MMPYKDLRSFLKKLETEKQLVHYPEPIAPTTDIGSIGRAATDLGHYGPAVMFDKIIGYKDQRLVTNVHGSWGNHALSLDLSKDTSVREQFFAVNDRWDKYPGEVEYVDNPPCQENVIEDDINMYEILPLHRINSLDGGCYLSKACIVTSEPYAWDDFEATNVGIYRIMILGPDTLALQLGRNHDAGEHVAQAEKENIPLPVAICLGNDPMLSFMASTPLEYHESEFHRASAFGGFTYEMARTLDGSLPIPANSEFILEGEVIPRKRVYEGPFGEFPGTYSGCGYKLLVKIKRITHRNKPIFEDLYIGFPWTESDTLIAINTSVIMYQQAKKDWPQLTAVNAMYQHGSTVIASTKQTLPGQAKIIALRLASTLHGSFFARNIVMVDDFVDPLNLEQVMWALSTRLRDIDISIINAVPGNGLLPSSAANDLDRKLIIDATTPVAPDHLKPNKITMPDPKCEEFKKLLVDLQNRL
jgi:UbiD family decarboxylase